MKNKTGNFTVNQNLIDFLTEKGIDERQVAKKIGKDASTIYRITAKKTVPHKNTMIAIANAYSLKPDYFFTQESQPKTIEANWKDEAYQNLKEEVEYYRALLLIASKKGLFTLRTGVKSRSLQLS